MAAKKKRSSRPGPKCKMIPSKSGKRVKRCWNAKGKFIKTPKR